MTKTKAIDSQTKNKILAATLDLATSDSSWKYSISDLKRVTGLSTGSIYHFFPKGADDISHALFVELLGDLKDSTLSKTEHLTSTELFIKKCVENFFDWHFQNEKKSIFLIRYSEQTQATPSQDVLKVREIFSLKLQKKLTDIVTQEFPKLKLDYSILLPAFFGSCQEFIKIWSSQGRPPALLKNVKLKMPCFLYNGFIHLLA